jgi:signal peptidase I
MEHLRTIVLAILLALTIRTGLAQAYLVEGPSMEPTLENGQRVLVVKYPYGLTLPAADEALVVWATPTRGDVVILSSPIDGIDLVKRVVGLPGDVIEVRDGRVLVNGEALATGATGPCPTPPGEDGCLWEEETSDGARWTTRRSPYAVPDSQPAITVPVGQVFVLGDHRDRSNDSRYFGPVSIGRLRGRVAFVD